MPKDGIVVRMGSGRDEGVEECNGSGEVKASAEMCVHAFQVLENALGQNAHSHISDVFYTDEEAGVFVTWSTLSSNSEQDAYALRGCIGTLSPAPLRGAIAQYAELAAFRDRRFDPISKHEVPTLQVAISLLSQFEDATNGVYDWHIGVHGIILTISLSSGRKYSATYLPEVCQEQRWTKEECIASLARKAGYSGRITKQVLDTATVTRYQSSKYTMTYQQFLAYANTTGPR